MNKDVAHRGTLLFSGLVILVILSLLGGCAKSTSPATPTPTKTPMIQARVANETPMPTELPAPTDTPTPADTPAPTATATLDPSLIVPAHDPGISPFTGLKPSDPSVLERRPLAIKVANLKSVRPQSGLSKADVVVESLIEFSASRFTAIYQSQDAPRVGSVRSARLIDLELPVIFDAVLCFSGGVEPVRQKLYKSDFGNRIAEALMNPSSYFRDPNIPVPDNMFMRTADLWKLAVKKGWNEPAKPTGAWAFSAAAPKGGASASRVGIPYPESKVDWAYDAASGRWLRSVGGRPHVEAADGKQLSAANVVVLTVPHVKTLILEHGTQEMAGGVNRSVEVQLWGEGPLKVFRDGKVYEGKWSRTDRNGPFRFLDSEGNDIPLKPGNSWWQVVPPEMKVTVGS